MRYVAFLMNVIVLVPGMFVMPFIKRPDSLAKLLSHTALYSGCQTSWRYSSESPVFVSITADIVVLVEVIADCEMCLA